MKIRYMKLKTIVFTAVISVALLGVAYAYWTETNYIFSWISTGEMKYSFAYTTNTIDLVLSNGETVPLLAKIEVGEKAKLLNIEIENVDAMLGMKKEKDKLRIQYTLEGYQGTKNNIALKEVEESIGEVNLILDKSSIVCVINGDTYSAAGISDLMPSSLGTFRMDHKFDGKKGSIELVAVKLTESLSLNMKASNLPEELKEVWESSKNKGDILIKGTYQFSIPLTLDQYNAS